MWLNHICSEAWITYAEFYSKMQNVIIEEFALFCCSVYATRAFLCVSNPEGITIFYGGFFNLWWMHSAASLVKHFVRLV